MSAHNHPRLTVVGAGPGDPELITLKGVRALADAAVVLYDALSNSELLAHARPDAVKVCVGKRRGLRAYSQEEINELIVQYARQHGHVVRLKGGDPFVFGRGREEMLYAEQHGLATDYVPGISSAVAAAGSIGIPVTHRGLSESFRVITATTANGQLSAEVTAVAQSPRTTAVILMGLSHLAEITNLFARYGAADRPAAVIQNGTLPTAQAVTGTVAELPTLVAAAGLAAPAVIIIGDVVQLATLNNASATEILAPLYAAVA